MKTTFKQFIEARVLGRGMSDETLARDTDQSDREYILQNQEKAKAKLDDAKMVINKARHSLGRDLGGYSVRDLLLDNIPVRSIVVDEILKLLRKEGFISTKHHGG